MREGFQERDREISIEKKREILRERQMIEREKKGTSVCLQRRQVRGVGSRRVPTFDPACVVLVLRRESCRARTCLHNVIDSKGGSVRVKRLAVGMGLVDG